MAGCVPVLPKLSFSFSFKCALIETIGQTQTDVITVDVRAKNSDSSNN